MPRHADAPLLEPSDRTEWRAWLAENHGASAGVWVAVGRKGGAVTNLDYAGAVEEALCFGWIDSTVRKLDRDRFTQYFAPRRAGGTWAPSNKVRVERLTAAGLMEPAGLAAVEAAKRDGSWESLDDAEALVEWPDLKAALDAVPKARANFDAFPASLRKMVLWWIASAKREETRQRRIAETVRSSERGRRPGGL